MRYNVDRELHLPGKMLWLISFVFSFWAFLVTLINVAAQGYETVTQWSSDFNSSNKVWYDNFIPSSQRSRNRNCTAAIIKLDDYLTTTNPLAIYDYQFEAALFPNANQVLGYGQAHYSNNLLQYCSVSYISMVEFLSPNPTYGAAVTCNDTASTYYLLNMYRSSLDVISLSSLPAMVKTLNVTQTYVAWAFAARQVWLNVFAPNNRENSMLRPSLLANNLDSLLFKYQDYWSDSKLNTPANTSWFLDVQWTVQNTTGTTAVPIYWLPTLEFDHSQTNAADFERVNRLLNRTLQKFASRNVDMWKLLNWVFVVQYWSLLYDNGQVQPTLYARADSGFPVFSTQQGYTDTNNIFVNDSLFKIYGDYFTSDILPLLQLTDVLTFQDLDSNKNVLTSVPTAFNMAYSCTQLQLKKPLSLVVSVLVADYTFITPAFGLIVLFGAWYQAKKNPRDGIIGLGRQLTVANWCEGCLLKGSEKGGGEDETARFLGQMA